MMSKIKKRRLTILFIMTLVGVSIAFTTSYYHTKRKFQPDISVLAHAKHLFNYDNIEAGTPPVSIFYAMSFITIAFSSIVAMRYNFKRGFIKDLHGSASWANQKDIQNAGLLGTSGVYVGGYKAKPKDPLLHLRDDSNTNVMVLGPTLSGKLASVIIPTLLTNAKKSFFVYDMKGQSYQATSGWREQAGNKVFVFRPAAEETHKYNFLAELDPNSSNFEKDVQNIATVMVEDFVITQMSKYEHIKAHAKEVLMAGIIHIVVDYPEEKRNIYEVGKLLKVSPERMHEAFEEYKENCSHEGAKNIFAGFLESDSDRQASALFFFKSIFELYLDPNIIRNTSGSDFTLSDLCDGETPTTVYYVISPEDVKRLSPITKLFITQLFYKIYSREKTKEKPKEVTVILGSFGSLGYLEIMERALSHLSNNGARLIIVAHSIEQLHKHYPEVEYLMGNCKTLIAMTPNDNVTATYLSNKLGTRTVLRKKVAYSGRRYGYISQKSEGIEEISRPLMTPDEVRRLDVRKGDKTKSGDGSGEMLIMCGGSNPIRGRQVLYDQNKVLLRRSEVEPVSLTVDV